MASGQGMPPGLQISPGMAPVMSPTSQYSMPNVSQIPNGTIMPVALSAGGYPGGTMIHSSVPPALPGQGHAQSLGGAMSSMGLNIPPGSGISGVSSPTVLEDVISPFISNQTPPAPSGKGATGPPRNSSYDFSDGLPEDPTSPSSLSSSLPQQRARMNPPAYSAAPSSGEARSRPTSTSDRKYVYTATPATSVSNINLAENNQDRTGAGTGMATHGSAPEPHLQEMEWGGSTVAASSEPGGTMVGEDSQPLVKDSMTSLNNIVAAVRAGQL
jgi:hypothetical protein